MNILERRSGHWVPWAGFGFAVLYFIGMAVLPNTPDDKASDAKWLAYYANSGNRTALIVSAFLLVLAGLCLMSFVAGIWTRLVTTEAGIPAHCRWSRPGCRPLAWASQAS